MQEEYATILILIDTGSIIIQSLCKRSKSINIDYYSQSNIWTLIKPTVELWTF